MDAHLIESLSSKLSAFNLPTAKKLLQRFNGTCDCCARSVQEAVIDKDGYGESRNVCVDCATLFYSDTGVIGWSKEPKINGKGAGLANTFNMMPMTSAIIPLGGRQKAILFPPPAKHAKIPGKILDFVEMELIQSKLARLIYAVSKVEPPFIYIDDFGRKAFDLVNGLSVTHSLSRLYLCDDTNVTLIDYQASFEIANMLKSINPAKRSAFITVVRRRALGEVTPGEALEAIKEDEVFLACSKLLPTDPHMHLNMLPIINGLIKEMEASR